MEMLSDQIKGTTFSRDLLPLVQGTVGEGVGLEFYNFCQLSDQLPSIKDILANPSTAEVPQKNSYKYAMSGILVEAFSLENAPAVMTYLMRMSKDFQYMIIKMAVTKDSSLLSVPEVDEWITTNSRYFYK